MKIPETSVEHYLTGIPALNIPHPKTGPADWHFAECFRGCFGRKPGPFPIAGKDFISTNDRLGDYGISEVGDILRRYGAYDVPEKVYAASHHRAYVDILIHVASSFGHCNPFPYDDWFTDEEALQILDLLTKAVPILPDDINRRVLSWYELQLPSRQSTSSILTS